jgi:carbon storage regulator
MLVLQRKSGQSIIIGESIKVTILRVGEGFIKIGIEAPQDVHIVREEIAEISEDRVEL